MLHLPGQNALVLPGDGVRVCHRRTRGAAAGSSLLTDLIAFWSLEEASGTRNDSHTNALHLTDNNTVTQDTGKVGSCAQFTSANSEFLSRASEALLQVGDNPFTFACWFYRDSEIAFNVIAGKGNEWYVNANAGGDNPRMVLNNDGASVAEWGAALSLATWYHLIAYWDKVGGKVGIQINNGTAVETSYSTPPSAGSSAFALGAYDGGASLHHNGRIDEAGLWLRLLTSGEKASLYGAGSGLAYPF